MANPKIQSTRVVLNHTTVRFSSQVRYLLFLPLFITALVTGGPAVADATLTIFKVNDACFQITGGVQNVSADGSTVVGGRCKEGGGSMESYRWTAAGGIEGLGYINYPFSITSVASAASADGSVIVGLAEDSAAYRWNAGEGMVRLFPEVGGAYGVSGDGAMIVGFRNGQPFRWTANDGVQSLGPAPTGFESGGASAVSQDGSVVVGAWKHSSTNPYGYVSENQKAFRWTQETGSVLLGDIPDHPSDSNVYATGVSGDGQVIVGYSTYGPTTSGMQAFRWTAAEGMRGLGDISGGLFLSHASSVSADGRIVVGGTQKGEGHGVAFFWTESTGARELQTYLKEEHGVDFGDWYPLGANISGDATAIVGTVYGPSSQVGETWGYIVRITDFDHDGVVAPTDCNDANKNVYPGAPEIKGDGVDQDCNGYDLTIAITAARYFNADKALVIEATSSLGSDAQLQVTNYGAMTWDSSRQTWRLVRRGVSAPVQVSVHGVEGGAVAQVRNF